MISDTSHRGAERQSGAARGSQFSQTPLAELRINLVRTNSRLRQLDSLRRMLMGGKPEGLDLGDISGEELGRLRREVFGLQTDLRAELRRRGEL
jgi:hypothetical protein